MASGFQHTLVIYQDRSLSLSALSMTAFSIWAGLDTEEKRLCANGSSEQGYGQDNFWYFAGKLRDYEDESLSFLESIRDAPGNRKKIYGTDKTSNKEKYPDLGLTLILAGMTTDAAEAWPMIVIECPTSTSGSSLRYGQNLKQLFEDTLRRQDKAFRVSLIEESDIKLSGPKIPPKSLRPPEPLENAFDVGGRGGAIERGGARNPIVTTIPLRPARSMRLSDPGDDHVTGKALFIHPSMSFSTFGGLLHLKPNLSMAVSTLHSLAQCTFWSTRVYTTSELEISETDQYVLIAQPFKPFFGSSAKMVGLYAPVERAFIEESYYRNEVDDWILLGGLDDRVSSHNIFPVPSGVLPLVDPLPLLEDRLPDEGSTAFFVGARSGRQSHCKIRMLCSIAVTGVARRVWAMDAECGR